MTEGIGNDFSTTLSAAILTTGTTSISVVSGTGAPAVNFRIRVDDEWMLVTSVGAGTNWTVQRGIEGSTAATHTVSTTVAHVLSKAGMDAYAFENWAAPFPGAETGTQKLVPAGHRFDVVDELIIQGELIIEGEVNLIAYS